MEKHISVRVVETNLEDIKNMGISFNNMKQEIYSSLHNVKCQLSEKDAVIMGIEEVCDDYIKVLNKARVVVEEYKKIMEIHTAKLIEEYNEKQFIDFMARMFEKYNEL